MLKMLEMGKALFSLSIVDASGGQQVLFIWVKGPDITPYWPQLQNHVSFLQEEMLKLPSFPRKALETEFGLHHGDGGKVSAASEFTLDYCKLWNRRCLGWICCINTSGPEWETTLLPCSSSNSAHSWCPTCSVECPAPSHTLETCLSSWTSSMALCSSMEKTSQCCASV